jgi:hypothetical protein
LLRIVDWQITPIRSADCLRTRMAAGGLMKRTFRYLVISAYLSVLLFGLAAHTFRYRAHDHLGMYFIVWDMYCGWTAWETRNHLIGQGDSGEWYDLSPPWGDMTPYGSAQRRDYDVFGLHGGTIAANTLKHSQHEPINRILMIEEAWPKRFNLPDEIWARRTPDPKQPYSYFHARASYGPSGEVEGQNPAWTNVLARNALLNNPRLRNEMVRSQPFITIENLTGSARTIQPVAHEESAPYR